MFVTLVKVESIDLPSRNQLWSLDIWSCIIAQLMHDVIWSLVDMILDIIRHCHII